MYTVKRLMLVHQKRPVDVSPEKIARLKKEGMKVSQMSVAWGISRSAIYALLKKAGWVRPAKKAKA